jgi:GNAT superfamily N-acetyltransferase
MTSSLHLARAEATPQNMKILLRLIRGAKEWLADKGTDQWQNPWPDIAGRDARVWRGLEVGATWIAWIGKRAAATVTVARTPNLAVWRGAECNADDPAIYAHRLIIDRQFAGWGLGAELIDWTGLRAHQEYGAKWIRIDVWSSNIGLHDYYRKRGFEPCGEALDPGYPSGKLFQKPVIEIPEPFCPLFTEPDPTIKLFGEDAVNVSQIDLAPPRFAPAERNPSLALCPS